jgi:hypothetical protein
MNNSDDKTFHIKDISSQLSKTKKEKELMHTSLKDVSNLTVNDLLEHNRVEGGQGAGRGGE